MDEEANEARPDDGRMPEDENFRKNDTEREYRYDNDFFEVEQPSDLEKEEAYEEGEWDEEEKSCRLYLLTCVSCYSQNDLHCRKLPHVSYIIFRDKISELKN